MPPPWYYVVWIFKTFSEVRGGISGQIPLSLMMAFSRLIQIVAIGNDLERGSIRGKRIKLKCYYK
jgi:hypothetical protein